MQVWQLQEAKAKLTQLIKDAQHEPQIISRHGINETIVMSIQQYQDLLGRKDDLVTFFKKSPLYGLDLDITRDTSGMRETNL